MLKRLSVNVYHIRGQKPNCFVSWLRKYSSLPLENDEKNNIEREKKLSDLRFKYPEFLPVPLLHVRNALREELERKDMMKRRNVIHLPVFYVGSILAVTTSNRHAPSKLVRFVGICISRELCGLSTNFILRNVVDHEGIEVKYRLYDPLIQKIEVLRLEKRLDDSLFYLRDAPLEYSTFPFDMTPQYVESVDEVPVNTLKVKLNPRPWYERWERKNLQGAILPELGEKIMEKAEKQKKPWEKYDLMNEYRQTIPEEEQDLIYGGIHENLKTLETKQKVGERKKERAYIPKQKLF